MPDRKGTSVPYSMPDHTHDVPPDALKWAWRAIVLVDVQWMLLMAATLWAGGEERMSSAAFYGLREATWHYGVSPLWWAFPSALGGLVLVAGLVVDSPGTRVIGYAIALMASGGLLGAFTVSALHDESVGFVVLTLLLFIVEFNAILLGMASYNQLRRDYRAGQE